MPSKNKDANHWLRVIITSLEHSKPRVKIGSALLKECSRGSITDKPMTSDFPWHYYSHQQSSLLSAVNLLSPNPHLADANPQPALNTS